MTIIPATAKLAPLVALAAGLAAFDAAAQEADVAVVAIDWAETATGLRGEHYNARRFACSPIEDPAPFPVWGTDIYTDHSSICAAAIHAGVITVEGGDVVIQEVDGLENYDGTARNGVTSLDLGAWFFSFQFLEGR